MDCSLIHFYNDLNFRDILVKIHKLLYEKASNVLFFFVLLFFFLLFFPPKLKSNFVGNIISAHTAWTIE